MGNLRSNVDEEALIQSLDGTCTLLFTLIPWNSIFTIQVLLA